MNTTKHTKIDTLLNPVNKFIQNESTGGIVLFVFTLIAIVWANSPFRESYQALWHVDFSIGFDNFMVRKSLHHWINDGLMAIFFFVVGLEMKREIVGGELSSLKNAVLPIAAGLGGMVVPAAIYALFNLNSDSINGWGIPMATDIAFALGLLSLLGNRVPLSLKIFFTALAIADDLGAVLVIAFFYTSNISMESLGLGVVFLAILLGGNYLGVRKVLFYGIFGIGGLWLAFLMSGVHATIAGVLAAFCIPAQTKIDDIPYINKLKLLTEKFQNAKKSKKNTITHEQLVILDRIKTFTKYAETPLQRLEHRMHPLVAYIVMPIFALSNAGVEFSTELIEGIFNPVSMGIIFGLVVGKFIGIVGISKIFVHYKWAQLPKNTSWPQFYGISLLAGVGFTMSLFVTELAFKYQNEMILQAKVGVLIASLLASSALFILYKTGKENADEQIEV